MRTAMAVLMAVALAGGAAFAQQAAGGGLGRQRTTKKVPKFIGSVTTIDGNAKKLTILGNNGKTVELSIGSVEMHKAGEAVPLSQVKAGDMVTVWYSGSAENPRAERIKVHTALKKGRKRGGGAGVQKSTATE